LLIVSFIFIGLLITNIFFLKSPLLFVCIGIVFLFTGWTWFDYLIHRNMGMERTPFPYFSESKLIWSSLFHIKKQAMLSFITLASGVFIVFSVGLNRQGFADTSQIHTATGGFSLWCETSVPVYHNIQTEEGRTKLALNDLPKEAHVIQLLKYSADDASCLNLNKIITPNVLGVPPLLSPSTSQSGDFQSSIKNFLFEIPSSEGGGATIPALIDETVLKWNLGKKLGDTIVYQGEKGETVYIQLVGTLQNSIFQGYILIDKTSFSEIWSEISGSEIMLISVPDTAIDTTKTLISQALNNYGVRVMTTGERLKMFYSVTDTYLTIFLTLGGLGLLLGIFSFIIVVRKNIVARLKEIILYRSLGFDEKRIFNLLYKENIIIPLYAVSTGALGSLLGISMRFCNVSVWVWVPVVAFLAIFIFCVMVFVKSTVRKYLMKIPCV
jgi:putative ABC transport system permease protein